MSQGKGKHFLQGIIGAIGVPELPAIIGGFVAYVRLSNVYTGQNVKLTFENAQGEALFEISPPFPSQADPLGVHTLIIGIPPFPISEAGRYMFVANHGGIPIASSPVAIRVAQPAQEEQ
jgi:hypothetical protein